MHTFPNERSLKRQHYAVKIADWHILGLNSTFQPVKPIHCEGYDIPAHIPHLSNSRCISNRYLCEPQEKRRVKKPAGFPLAGARTTQKGVLASEEKLTSKHFIDLKHAHMAGFRKKSQLLVEEREC